MVNVGLDFGSTNTLLSIYDYEHNVPEIFAVQGTESYTIPSYVAYNMKNGRYEYGAKARNRLGNVNTKVYRAFKMLLRESDETALREWNYDQDNTPEKIAGLFIKYILTNVLKECKEEKIGTLTIGIPEIWRKPNERLKRNTSLLIREICEGLNLAEKVNIVTEPEAASAYFAFKYMEQHEHKDNFNGHILVVDYGGGTLDITLAEVRPRTSSDKKTKYNMQILTKERTGAGENIINEDNSTLKVGNAGILYIESVIDRALEKAGIDPDSEKTANFDKYSRLLRDFETELITSRIDIEEVFSEYEGAGINKPISLENLDEEYFTEIEYNGKGILVTYGIMARVYYDVIAPTLEEKLSYIIDYMNHEGIDYQKGDPDAFQIALVGGFGNFYLVKEQLQRIINSGVQNKIIVGDNECEKAIAFGTALYANEIVGHKYTSPYALGMRLTDADGDSLDVYAFHYREEIEPNKVYFIEIAGKAVMFRNRQDIFNQFIRKDDREDTKTQPIVLRLKPEFADMLQGITGQADYFHLGLSLDEYDRLSLYAYDYIYDSEKNTRVRSENPRKVTLSELNEIFLSAK